MRLVGEDVGLAVAAVLSRLAEPPSLSTSGCMRVLRVKDDLDIRKGRHNTMGDVV